MAQGVIPNAVQEFPAGYKSGPDYHSFDWLYLFRPAIVRAACPSYAEINAKLGS